MKQRIPTLDQFINESSWDSSYRPSDWRDVKDYSKELSKRNIPNDFEAEWAGLNIRPVGNYSFELVGNPMGYFIRVMRNSNPTHVEREIVKKTRKTSKCTFWKCI
jgi:hypothetical protein